jgi:hypothetical protein
MVVMHYEFMVLTIPTLNGVITLHADHVAAHATIKKLQALAAAGGTTDWE